MWIIHIFNLRLFSDNGSLNLSARSVSITDSRIPPIYETFTFTGGPAGGGGVRHRKTSAPLLHHPPPPPALMLPQVSPSQTSTQVSNSIEMQNRRDHLIDFYHIRWLFCKSRSQMNSCFDSASQFQCENSTVFRFLPLQAISLPRALIGFVTVTENDVKKNIRFRNVPTNRILVIRFLLSKAITTIVHHQQTNVK